MGRLQCPVMLNSTARRTSRAKSLYHFEMLHVSILGSDTIQANMREEKD
jgi:hypothetical protein